MATESPQIAVVGSYNHGLSMAVEALPAPGETVLGGDFAEGVGGKGSNQAVGAARLGAATSFVGCIGEDRFGDAAVDLWDEEAVDARDVRRTGATHTGVGFVIVDGDGENAISVAPGANSRLSAADVRDARETIRSADVLLCQLETELDPVVAAADIAADAGTEVILNPAPARELPESLLANVDILTPNRGEACILAGHDPAADVPESSLLDALSDLGVSGVALTLGADGALVDDGGTREHVDAIDVDVVDTTGGGDAFNAGAAVARANGQPLAEAVRFGNVCGGLACTAFEVVPALPDRAAVEAYLAP
ncbi:ribokinase [Halobellus salinus]|uniref:Ribokinase n=1 Tax=Halobellus salinus TaxID=931585 RepID=A0A830EPZ2_9EURY|nr:ribokinase [Halobellus salinus]GGJ10215.1 ribokinase [Halobellus salinus]SMP24457.1 ribokinase [Halobellus salinus]